MDRNEWIGRFAARMQKLGVETTEEALLKLGNEVFAMGSHLSPDTVARIESEIATGQIPRRTISLRSWLGGTYEVEERKSRKSTPA